MLARRLTPVPIYPGFVSETPGAPLLPRFLRQSGSFDFIPQATFLLDSTGNPASRHASNPPLRAQA
jgi:hypothetical protein